MYMVWFCTETNIVSLILYTKSRIVSLLFASAMCDQWRVPGMGNCLFLHAQGWGIDCPVRKNGKSPGGMPGRGGGVMVTGGIEPYIMGKLQWSSTCTSINLGLTRVSIDIFRLIILVCCRLNHFMHIYIHCICGLTNKHNFHLIFAISRTETLAI